MTHHKIRINRSFNCSVAELFKWLSDPKRIKQWFGPASMKVVSVHCDLNVDGLYEITLEKPNGAQFSIHGKYLEVRQPELLSFTFQYKGIEPAPPESIVHMQVSSTDEKSQLTLTQTFDLEPSDMANRTKAWDHMLEYLSRLI